MLILHEGVTGNTEMKRNRDWRRRLLIFSLDRDPQRLDVKYQYDKGIVLLKMFLRNSKNIKKVVTQ